MLVLQGKPLAQSRFHGFASRLAKLCALRSPPCLSVVQLGDREDSNVYISKKRQACQQLGIACNHIKLPIEVLKDQQSFEYKNSKLWATIDALNKDPMTDGIILQLPVPGQYSEAIVQISPSKDIDGIQPWNLGQLARRDGTPHFVPCTAKATLALLEIAMNHASDCPSSLAPINAAALSNYGVDNIFALKEWLRLKRVTIMGRSDIVGLPTFLSLLKLNCRVNILHSHCGDPSHLLHDSDVVIIAIGKPQYVKPHWIKPEAVVIDVGMNPIAVSDSKKILLGDLDRSHPSALKHIGALTPVPGGVGPVTVAMLIDNLILAAERTVGLAS